MHPEINCSNEKGKGVELKRNSYVVPSFDKQHETVEGLVEEVTFEKESNGKLINQKVGICRMTQLCCNRV